MMKNPAVLHALLSHLACNIADYVCYQIEAGAQVVQLFDSWAHHLNPSQFATFSLPYAEEVIQRVRKRHPDTPIIFHANGGKLFISCLPDMSSTAIFNAVFQDTQFQCNNF